MDGAATAAAATGARAAGADGEAQERATAPTRHIRVPDAAEEEAAPAGVAWAAGAEAGEAAAEETAGEVNHGGEAAALRAGALDETRVMPTRQVWAGASTLDGRCGAAGAAAEDGRCKWAGGAAVDDGAAGASARRVGSRAETRAMPTRHVRASAESVELTACAGLGCVVGGECWLEETTTGPTRQARNRLSRACRLSLLGSVMFFMYDCSSI